MERKTPLCPMLMQGAMSGGMFAAIEYPHSEAVRARCACIGSLCAWWTDLDDETLERLDAGVCGHLGDWHRKSRPWPDPAREDQP